jgi:transcriptional regulator with XRE-family HTH domain
MTPPSTTITIGQALGERLRAARRNTGLSLLDVQAKTSGEFRAGALSSYERGERAISALRLIRLAAVYGVPAETLLVEATRRHCPTCHGSGFVVDLPTRP